MKIDITCALVGIALIEIVTWATSSVPNNLTAGMIIGLAAYIGVRLAKSGPGNM